MTANGMFLLEILLEASFSSLRLLYEWWTRKGFEVSSTCNAQLLRPLGVPTTVQELPRWLQEVEEVEVEEVVAGVAEVFAGGGGGGC
jgi:hypothetical protein